MVSLYHLRKIYGIPPARRGDPKIDVTFDIDANGCLVVTAEVKSANIKKSITITNDKGRMSKEEVDRLLQEAEKYKEEDTLNRERIEAKNELENYIFSTRSTFVENEEVKLSEKDKAKILETIDEGSKWLDGNQTATKEEYVAKREELSDVISPIVAKMYKGATEGVPGFPDVAEGTGPQEAPEVADID